MTYMENEAYINVDFVVI